MRQYILSRIYNLLLFAVSIILAWVGMIYATNDPGNFRVTGIILSLIGYGLFFWAVLRFEKNSGRQS